jgi:anti-sigma B factor antagonist
MKYELEAMGKFTMVRIFGNLDSAETTKALDDLISAHCSKGHRHYVFNLERTTYLDSAGISIFIHCLCYVQENEGSIFIVAEDNQVRRVLEMVGINRLITTYGSMKEFQDAQMGSPTS